MPLKVQARTKGGGAGGGRENKETKQNTLKYWNLLTLFRQYLELSHPPFPLGCMSVCLSPKTQPVPNRHFFIICPMNKIQIADHRVDYILILVMWSFMNTQVWPISQFPVPEVNQNSIRIVEHHRTAWPNAQIIQQVGCYRLECLFVDFICIYLFHIMCFKPFSAKHCFIRGHVVRENIQTYRRAIV